MTNHITHITFIMDLPIYVRLQASNICEEPGYRSVLAKSKGPLCQKILAESPWDKRLSGLSAVSLATKSCIKAARHNWIFSRATSHKLKTSDGT